MATRVVDVTGQGIGQVAHIPGQGAKEGVAAVIADHNHLSTLTGIGRFSSLIQLSVRENSLVRMGGVAPLSCLVSLNLQSNSITSIAGLEGLTHLQWLCLAGNSIRDMSGFSFNSLLNHVDLSDNCIDELADLSVLKKLNTLLLHGNAVSSLQRASTLLPSSLSILSLAENELADLNEVSYLAGLNLLTQLSVMGNPCVAAGDSTMFDYRPFLLYHCPALTTLDGIVVGSKERQRGMSLFLEGCPFSPGDQEALGHHLTIHCPLSIVTLLTGSTQLSSNDCDGQNLNSTLLPLPKLQLGEGEGEGEDISQKLKALQLVQQMIAAQEQLLRRQAQTAESTSLLDSVSDIQSHSRARHDQSTLSNGTVPLPPSPPSLLHQLPSGVSSGRLSSGAGLPHTLHGAFEQPSLEGGAASPRDKGQSADVRADRQLQSSVHSARSVTPQSRARPDRSTERREEIGGSETPVSSVGRTAGFVSGGSQDQLRQLLSEERQQRLKSLNEKLARTRRQELATAGLVGASNGSVAPHHSGAKAVGGSKERRSINLAFSPTVAGGTGASVHRDPSSVAPLSEHNGTRFQPPPDAKLHFSDYRLPGVPMDVPVPTPSSPSQLGRGGTVSLLSGHAHPLSGQGSEDELSFSATDFSASVSLPPMSDDMNSTITTTHGTQLLPQSGALESNADFMATDPDLLDSTSTYLPAPTTHGEQSALLSPDLSALASSLSTAYGLSGFSDHPLCLPNAGRETASQLESHAQPRGGSPLGVTMVTGSPGPFEPVCTYDPPAQLSYCQFSSNSPGGSFDPGVADDQQGGRTEWNGSNEPGPNRRATAPSSALPPQDHTHQHSSHAHFPRNGSELSFAVGTVSVFPNDDFRMSSTVPGDMGQTGSISKVPPSTSGGANHPLSGEQGAESCLSLSSYAVKIQAAFRGFLCRRRLGLLLQQSRAAAVIQAAWRGRRARNRDPSVVSVRSELARMKMERYVATLYIQMQGCRTELAHQAQLVQLQEETIRSLMVEVDALQQWKARVERDQKNKAATVIQKYWRRHQLKKVAQLECDLSHESHVQVEIRERYKRMGFITSNMSKLLPPMDLQIISTTPSSVLLQWRPCPTSDVNVLQGYMLCVNGHFEGMVRSNKSSTYIEGLGPVLTYRFTVRAVYDCGVSRDSNAVTTSVHSPAEHSPGKQSPSRTDPPTAQAQHDVPFGELDRDGETSQPGKRIQTQPELALCSSPAQPLAAGASAGGLRSTVSWSAAELGPAAATTSEEAPLPPAQPPLPSESKTAAHPHGVVATTGPHLGGFGASSPQYPLPQPGVTTESLAVGEATPSGRQPDKRGSPVSLPPPTSEPPPVPSDSAETMNSSVVSGMSDSDPNTTNDVTSGGATGETMLKVEEDTGPIAERELHGCSVASAADAILAASSDFKPIALETFPSQSTAPSTNGTDSSVVHSSANPQPPVEAGSIPFTLEALHGGAMPASDADDHTFRSLGPPETVFLTVVPHPEPLSVCAGVERNRHRAAVLHNTGEATAVLDSDWAPDSSAEALHATQSHRHQSALLSSSPADSMPPPPSSQIESEESQHARFDPTAAVEQELPAPLKRDSFPTKAKEQTTSSESAG